MSKTIKKKFLFEIEIGNKKENNNKFPIVFKVLKSEGVKIIRVIELIN